MRLYEVIKHPIFSEKSYAQQHNDKAKYTFVVKKDASKIEIAKAFHEIFDIKPVKINILNVKPSKIRTGTKHPGVKPGFKKAIITLPAGIKLNIAGEENSEDSAKAESKE